MSFLLAGRTRPAGGLNGATGAPRKKGCGTADSQALLASQGVDGEAFTSLAATFLRKFGLAFGAQGVWSEVKGAACFEQQA